MSGKKILKKKIVTKKFPTFFFSQKRLEKSGPEGSQCLQPKAADLHLDRAMNDILGIRPVMPSNHTMSTFCLFGHTSLFPLIRKTQTDKWISNYWLLAQFWSKPTLGPFVEASQRFWWMVVRWPRVWRLPGVSLARTGSLTLSLSHWNRVHTGWPVLSGGIGKFGWKLGNNIKF